MTGTTPEGRILAALLRRTESAPGALPMVADNIEFPPPGEDAPQTYLLVSVSPGAPERRHIDPKSENLLRGVLGIAVMSPLDEGPQGATDLAGALAAWLDGEDLTEDGTRVRIVSRPRVVGGYKDRDRWRTPVVAEYEATGV